MTRPEWDSYFLAIAATVATRATCPKRSVGAVIVDAGHRLIATGYNGAPPGAMHCTASPDGCHELYGHCQNAAHAEWNALRHNVAATRGATIYIHNGTPCFSCARAILGAGIARVVSAGRPYHDPEAVALLRHCGVAVETMGEQQ